MTYPGLARVSSSRGPATLHLGAHRGWQRASTAVASRTGNVHSILISISPRRPLLAPDDAGCSPVTGLDRCEPRTNEESSGDLHRLQRRRAAGRERCADVTIRRGRSGGQAQARTHLVLLLGEERGAADPREAAAVPAVHERRLDLDEETAAFDASLALARLGEGDALEQAARDESHDLHAHARALAR